MQPALVVEWYLEIPRKTEPEPELAWKLQHQRAVDRFRRQVSRRYTCATLERLIESNDALRRQASGYALGLIGSQDCNPLLNKLLFDPSPEVRAIAEESIWNLWFRGSTEAHNQELRRIARMRDRKKALLALDNLVRKASGFAEAHHQRGMVYQVMGRHIDAVADFSRALELNTFHFAAQASLAHSLCVLGKERMALRAFRSARDINPNIEGIDEKIEQLERLVGGGGSPDDSMHGV